MITLKALLEQVKHTDGIMHVEHPSDRSFDGSEAANDAVKTLKDVVSGHAPVTRKIDDKMSFQAIRDKKGRIGVKYKGPGSHYNYSNDDIDTQHGHKPYLAAPLKALLEHIGKVLPKREGEYQGGFLSTPEGRTIKNGRISHQPNTIEYSVPTDTKEGKKLKNSKVSAAIHTELVGPNREAHPVLDTSEFSEHPDVHLMGHVVSNEEQGNIDPTIKKQASSHLTQAEKLLQNHSFGHLHGHENHLRSYINSTVSTGAEPSVEGYIDHLKQKHQKEIDKVKMEKTKEEKAAKRDADISHVQNNRKAFEKSLKIHGHIQQATNLLARGLGRSAHGGYGHAIEHEGNMRETGPEGFVANGLKIVDRGEGGFSQANRARSAILRASPKLAKKV